MKLFKILITLTFLLTTLHAGWVWNTTKSVGKAGVVYGAKKAIDVYKKNTKKKIFTKKEVNGRTTYQQKIDPDLKVTRTNPRTGENLTETNLDRMQKGQPPYVNKNGKTEPIELHHSRQNDNGSLFELSKSTHQIKNKDKGAKALHPYGSQKNPDNPVPKNRNEFNQERVEYYKNRAIELLKGKK